MEKVKTRAISEQNVWGGRLLPRETSDKNYNGIDLIKFICAVLVITMHIDPFPTGNGLFDYINFAVRNYIARIAVPFFFVCSGFFLFRKIDVHHIDTGRIKNYCFKLLRLLGLWSMLLCIGDPRTYHLWYLSAMVIAVFLLTLMLRLGAKSGRYGFIYIIAAALYVIGLLGSSYYGIIEPLSNTGFLNYIISGYEALFVNTRNGVFFGFIYVFMGFLFAQKNIKMNMKAAVAGFALSMAFLLIEVFALEYFSLAKNHDMYVFLVPAVFFLFYTATHLNLRDRAVYGRLRGVGTLTYFSHLLVRELLKYAFSVIQKLWGIDLTPLLFIATVMVTVLLAFLVERLSRRNGLKWLRYLYS